MTIIISGMPFFSKKLASELSEYDKQNKYIYLNTFYSIKDKIKFMFYILFADIYYLHGGDIGNSGTINLALKLNKKVVMNWAGTDVLKAQSKKNSGNYSNEYINKISHYCGSTWLKEELLDIGIKAEILDIMIINSTTKNLIQPKEFTVLTYIGQDRPEFYGIKTILKLASDFKNIRFRVAGLSEYEGIPTNVELLGWTDMNNEYMNMSAYIRNPEHDGLSCSVLEALSYGKVVFYNYNYNHVNYFNNYESLKNQLQEVIRKFKINELKTNNQAINFVQKEFSREKIMSKFIGVFNNV